MLIKFRLLSLITTLFFTLGSKAATNNPKIDFNNLYLEDILRLNAHDLYKLTGHRMNLKERMAFTLSKGPMKRALRKHGNIKFNEYLSLKRDPGIVGGILLLIGGIILLIFVLFLVFYKD